MATVTSVILYLLLFVAGFAPVDVLDMKYFENICRRHAVVRYRPISFISALMPDEQKVNYEYFGAIFSQFVFLISESLAPHFLFATFFCLLYVGSVLRTSPFAFVYRFLFNDVNNLLYDTSRWVVIRL